MRQLDEHLPASLTDNLLVREKTMLLLYRNFYSGINGNRRAVPKSSVPAILLILLKC